MTHRIQDDATIGGTLDVTGAVSASNFSGSSSGANSGDQTSVTGNAGTATKLATARAINGVNFDGSANISVNATTGTPADLAATASLGSSALAAKADHVHKAPGVTSAEVALGSNFSLTAINTYQDTGLQLTLPDIGKYLLSIDLMAARYAGFGAFYFQWYDNTAGASLRDVPVARDSAASDSENHFQIMVTTTVANRVIKIRAAQTATTTPYCIVRGETVARYVLLGKT